MWGSSAECFKYPLVAWEKICLPRELGGLGIHNLVSFNQYLLGKWLWRYGHETSHLWRRVIAMKYGEGKGEWSTRVCRWAHGCGLWRNISEGWESFSRHVSFVVGDGSCFFFFFGMISGLGIILSNLSILSFLRVQPIRKLVSLKC